MTILIPVTVTSEAERTWAKELIYQSLQETEGAILVIDHGSTYLKPGVDHERIEWKGPQGRITQLYFKAGAKVKYEDQVVGEFIVVDPAKSGVPVG